MVRSQGPTRYKQGMTSALRQPWTQEEFYAWAQAQIERFEFDGSAPVAMTGGTNTHSALHRTLLVSLDRRLADRPCQVMGPDAGLATVGGAVLYPDAPVTCSPVTGGVSTVENVVIIFEVVSRGSGRLDRVIKLREYAAVASILCYVIVESTSIALTCLAKPPAPRHGRRRA